MAWQTQTRQDAVRQEVGARSWPASVWSREVVEGVWWRRPVCKRAWTYPTVSPQPIAYACPCPYPPPLACNNNKKTEIDYFFFIFYFFIITCVPSPLIVFVRLTCPDRLSPIPKILFEGIEKETSESVSRPNKASEQLPQISAISQGESSDPRTAKGWMVRRGTRLLSILAFINVNLSPGLFNTPVSLNYRF